MADVDKKVVGTLNSIPFESIIGGPLSACINAQADAALSTVNFIKSVGLTEDEEGIKAVYVVFSYLQNGRMVNISVPLLTIVPIPYIAIHNINIDFKLAVSGVEHDSFESTSSYEKNKEIQSESKKGLGILRKKKTSKMNTNISTKRDSKSTRDSTYSVEATIDVSVQAGQESMPAGMAKILELLGGAVDVVSTRGELSYDGPYTTAAEDKFLIVRYKSPEGIYLTEGVACSGSKRSEVNEEGDAQLFYFDKGTKTTTITAPAPAEGKEALKREVTL
jgi:hypothetical protein